MQLKNFQIQPFIELLFNMELTGRKSRMRTRLIRLLEDHWVNLVQQENKVLLDECAEKNEDGEIVVNQATGLISLLPHKAEYYHNEYEDLMNECFHLESNEQNKQLIKEIYEILDSYDYPLSGQTATLYDEVCTVFEEAVGAYY